VFEKTLVKEFLNKNARGYYKKVAEKAERDFNGWRIINKQESCSCPFDGFNPCDISVLFMIYQGKTNSQICTIMGLSPKELRNTLETCCKLANVKNKNELKNHMISQISVWFKE